MQLSSLTDHKETPEGYFKLDTLYYTVEMKWHAGKNEEIK